MSEIQKTTRLKASPLCLVFKKIRICGWSECIDNWLVIFSNAETRDRITRPNREGTEKSNLFNGESQKSTATVSSSVCAQASAQVKNDT